MEKVETMKNELPEMPEKPAEVSTPATETKPVETEKKKGRPPGKRNIPRDKPPVMRKEAGDIKNKKEAAKVAHERLQWLLNDMDKESGSALSATVPSWEEIEKGKARKLEPQIGAEVVASVLFAGFSALGNALDVTARPANADLLHAGKAISDLSAFMPPVSPFAVALTVVVTALGQCAAPMIAEKIAQKKGLVLPASELPVEKEIEEMQQPKKGKK